MWRFLPGVGGYNHTAGQYFRWILVPLIGATLCFRAYGALSLWEVGIPTQPLIWYVETTAVPAAATWLLYLLVCAKPMTLRLQLLWKLSISVILLSLCMGSAEWLIATRLAPFLAWGVYVAVVPPLIGISFYAALAVFAGISSTFLKDRDREWLSRVVGCAAVLRDLAGRLSAGAGGAGVGVHVEGIHRSAGAGHGGRHQRASG